jgi:hypothetical protein
MTRSSHYKLLLESWNLSSNQNQYCTVHTMQETELVPTAQPGQVMTGAERALGTAPAPARISEC